MSVTDRDGALALSFRLYTYRLQVVLSDACLSSDSHFPTVPPRPPLAPSIPSTTIPVVCLSKPNTPAATGGVRSWVLKLGVEAGCRVPALSLVTRRCRKPVC